MALSLASIAACKRPRRTSMCDGMCTVCPRAGCMSRSLYAASINSPPGRHPEEGVFSRTLNLPAGGMQRTTVSPDFARADYQPLKFILGQRTRQLAAQPPAIAPAGHHVLDPYESQLRPVAFRNVHFQQQQCAWPELSPCD